MKPPRELLKAAAIDAMAAENKQHRINPNAVRLSKSLGDATGLSQLGIHLVTVMPGKDSTEYHRHHYEEECLYILSGVGEAVIDGQSHEVGAGDFMGFPRGGAAHGLSNNGSAPLVYLVAGQRLEQDVCDYPDAKLRLFINGEKEDYVDFDDLQTRSSP